MGWLTLIFASTISAAIIMYVFWPTTSDGKQRKTLALLLALAAFILPAGLKYFFTENSAQVTPDISSITSQLPTSDSALWSGERTQPSASSGKDLSMSSMTARLEEKLRQNPDNISGWILLGRSYIALGESNKAIKVFEERIEENPENIDLLVSYGESLSKINQGIISEKAKNLFIKALALDIKNPRTGYNMALYEIQNQQYQLAHDRLKALLDNAQAGAPYTEQLKEQMVITEEKLGLTPTP